MVDDLARLNKTPFAHSTGIFSICCSRGLPCAGGIKGERKIFSHSLCCPIRTSLPLLLPQAITSAAKQKNAGANDTRFLALSLAPAFYAQAFDIQNDFSLAVVAVDWQRNCFRLRRDPKQSFVPFADRALHPTILYVYYTTTNISLQQFSLHFVCVFQKLYIASSTNKYKDVQFSDR